MVSPPAHRLLQAAQWRRAASSSSSLYIEISETEWEDLLVDAGLRAAIEQLLAAQPPAVHSLLFVHVVDLHPHGVAELYRDGTGEMVWQLERRSS